MITAEQVLRIEQVEREKCRLLTEYFDTPQTFYAPHVVVGETALRDTAQALDVPIDRHVAGNTEFFSFMHEGTMWSASKRKQLKN